jgi:prevent-host-death family protein
MARKRPFALCYDPEVHRHLRAIEAKYYSLIRTIIEEQLRFEPENETRNRKPLQRPISFKATWELRFGPENRFRVFYAVNHERREVQILAIGVKARDRLDQRRGGGAMKIASVADVKAHFSAFLKATEQGPVVVTRNGKPVAVLMAVGDEEELERLVLAQSPHLQTILDAARQRMQAGLGIPHEDFWQEVESAERSGKPSPGRGKKT